jgi:hypothetical protein
MPTEPSVRRGWRRFLAPAVVAVLLLAGCQGTPDTDLEDELAAIGGVTQVDVDAERVKVTLAGDILAADAATAILAVRDRAVASHALGDDVELVIVLPAGPRDLGGAQPSQVYSYGSWSAGAAADAAFEQQVTFFASLADWETLLAGPAQFRHVGFTVTGVAGEAPAETDAPVEGEEAPVEGEEAPGEGEEALSVQLVTVQLRQPHPTENLDTDVAAAIAELTELWVASGGLPEAITIS